MNHALLEPETAPASEIAAPAHPPMPQPNPEAFKLAGDPPRVMRLSRKTLAMLGLVAGLGIGGSLLFALRSHHPVPPANLYDTGSHAKSEIVTSAPGSYDKVPKLGPPLPGDLGRPILAAQQGGQVVPVPAMGAQSASPSDPRMAAIDQARARMGQERDAARMSRLFLGGNGGAAAASVMPASGGIAPDTGVLPNAMIAAKPDGAATAQDEKRAFLSGTANRITSSAERLSTPISPYVVQAGSVIPAALITGIRSDLPGQVTAQVTQSVYDSVTGRVLLVPQGSRLIGEYDSQVAAGQSRVLLAWDRLILPDGRSIVLDRQPGADASGAAGLHDGVNYHWGNMLRAAAISTMLGAGTQLATNGNDPLTQALRYGTQDTINQVGKQLVQREINVQPTLTIRPGLPLRVIITRDLVLEPPEGKP